MKNVIKTLALFVISCCCSFSTQAADTAASSGSNYSVTIENPTNEAVLENDTQDVKVTFSITPALKPDVQAALLVDDKISATGYPGNKELSKMSLSASNLERGSHTLQVLIKSKDGKALLGKSSTITVYQQRPSKLLPAH